MIIIRTIHNLSYFALDYKICNGGIDIIINNDMTVFIPDNEISEIIKKSEVYAWNNFKDEFDEC